MSTKIGGPHRCNIHPDFPETDDQDVWNEHCETAEGHTTTGTCQCSNCECDINLNEIPYQPIGKEIKLQCPECYGKTQDLNKLVNEQNEQRIVDQEIQEQGAGKPQ